MDRLTTPISSWLPILARKEKQIEEFQRRLDPAENVYIGVKDLQQNKIHLLKQVQEEKKKLECMRDQLAVYRRLNQELLHECRDRFRRMEEERAEMEKKNKEKFV